MKKLSEKGFTLVEIVIVLAIAGLIMVIVFVGVQGAQRARRDAVRKNDNARIAALLEQFRSNNNGNYPNAASFTTTTSGNFNGDYLQRDISLDNEYTYTTTATTCNVSNAGTVYYSGTGGTTYSLKMCLESGEDTRSQ